MSELKTELHNPGISLRVPEATCEDLCGAVSNIPGVAVTRKKPPFWSITQGVAEFMLRGHTFLIDEDEWDGVYWILSEGFQKYEAEMHEVQAAVERYVVPGIKGAVQRLFSKASLRP